MRFERYEVVTKTAIAIAIGGVLLALLMGRSEAANVGDPNTFLGINGRTTMTIEPELMFSEELTSQETGYVVPAVIDSHEGSVDDKIFVFAAVTSLGCARGDGTVFVFADKGTSQLIGTGKYVFTGDTGMDKLGKAMCAKATSGTVKPRPGTVRPDA